MTAASVVRDEGTPIEYPKDSAEVIATVLAAATGGDPTSIEGSVSKAPMLRPIQAARTLSVRDLTGITLHSPSDIVLSARAGTPLASIEATLADLAPGVAVLPPLSPAFARLTKRMKDKGAFDPHGILNPGRMYAGI